MTHKSDPLAVLLRLNSELGKNIDESLVRECYQVQKEHQYDKGRDTVTKMKAIVEKRVVEQEGSNLV
ncbi:MAG: hypothetical protein HAW67_07130 [Endozoicomonadaceae bacterium]|nr:hypothetical protein [Endozoicomonadaceae bacterium]